MEKRLLLRQSVEKMTDTTVGEATFIKTKRRKNNRYNRRRSDGYLAKTSEKRHVKASLKRRLLKFFFFKYCENRFNVGIHYLIVTTVSMREIKGVEVNYLTRGS